MSKKSRFKGYLDKEHDKRPEALLKSASPQLYHIHRSLLSQLSWQKSLLLTCKILGLLVNTLIADEKYPVLNGDNLKIPIKMQLSYKQKNFSRFFTIVLTSRLKFKRFEKKDDPRNFCISDITNSENVVR